LVLRPKTEKELTKIRESSQITAQVLRDISGQISPGVSTAELDRFAEKLVLKYGGQPAFKGYLGYPNTLCTSVNEQIVHGIPSKRRLQEGDIISLDLGVCWEGYYSDAAVTVPVGEVSPAARRLIEVTRQALKMGIEQARAGARLSNISHAVQTHVEGHGYSVVKVFVGHGIGRRQQEEPQIPNYGLPGRGVKLKRGLVLAIEPMVNLGSDGVIILEDNWTAVTKDNSLSAHFEHTIAITDGEPEILTQLGEG
jgi:methionyl aminopeptidase